MRFTQYIIIAIIRTINFDLITEYISCNVSISYLSHSVTKVELHMRKENLLSFEYNLSLEGYTDDIPYNITIGNCLSLNNNLRIIAFPRYFEYRINPRRKNIISSQNVTLELVTNCNDNHNNISNDMSIVASTQQSVTNDIQHERFSSNKHKERKRYDNERTIAFVVFSLIFVVYIVIIEKLRCMKSEIHHTKIIFKLSKMKRKTAKKDFFSLLDSHKQCLLQSSLSNSNVSKKYTKGMQKCIGYSNFPRDFASKNTVFHNFLQPPCITSAVAEDEAQSESRNEDIFFENNDIVDENISSDNFHHHNKSHNESIQINFNANDAINNDQNDSIQQQINENIQYRDASQTKCMISEIHHDSYDLEEEADEPLHSEAIADNPQPYSEETMEVKNEIPVILSTIPDSEEGWGELFKSIYVSTDLRKVQRQEGLDAPLPSDQNDYDSEHLEIPHNADITKFQVENTSYCNGEQTEINENKNDSYTTNHCRGCNILPSMPRRALNATDKKHLQTSSTTSSVDHVADRATVSPGHLVTYTYNNRNTLTALSRPSLPQENDNSSSSSSSALHPSQWSCAEDIPKSPERLLPHPRVTPKYGAK